MVSIRQRVLFLLFLALLLRLPYVGGRPLWYDEAFSLLLAAQSPAAIIAGTVGSEDAAAEEHPPLYYLLLHSWMAVVGNQPGAARALSLLLGTATVPLLYLLARRLVGERAAHLAGVLAAFSPFHVYYSQEARMYALVALLSVVTVIFFLRGWTDGAGHNWLLFAGSAALLLYSHNAGVLVLVALDLWIVYSWRHDEGRDRRRAVVYAHLLLLLFYSPWLAVLPGQWGKLSGGAYWLAQPGITVVLQTSLIFHTAYDNQALPSWLLPPALLLSLLVPALLGLTFARQRRTPAIARQEATAPNFRVLLLLLAFGPPLLAFLISQVQPIYVVRALLPSALFYYVLVAHGVQRMPRPLRGGLGLLALVVVGTALLNHFSYRSFPRAPFAEATAYLGEVGEGRIVHGNKLSFLPASYHAPDLSQYFVADAPGSPGDTLAPATQVVLGVSESSDLASAVGPADEVWFVLFRQAVTEYEVEGKEHPHLVALERQYGPPRRVVSFEDLFLYQFGAPENP